jgi:glucans biosynthesis protein C
MNSVSTVSQRLPYIDVLRILAVLWLIPFHVARIFDIWEPNYIKSPVQSIGLTALLGLTSPWHMPLFFLLAGASTWLALNVRTEKQYLRERITRLLLPLLICGTIFIPLLPYYALLDHGVPPSSYWTFLQTYYCINTSDLTGYFGTFTPSHLWFILYLFVFSVITLPIFRYLHPKLKLAESKKSRFNQIAEFCDHPGRLYLLVIPLTLTELLPDLGGKNPFLFLIYFILGFFVLSNERYLHAIDFHKKFALIIGIPCLIYLNYIWFLDIDLEGITMVSAFFALFRHFTCLNLIIAILGYGKLYLNKNYSWLRNAGEIAYPFYILHQIIIGIIGFYIIRGIPGVILEFFVICSLSFLITFGLCELIKKTNFTRVIFGMKLISKENIKQKYS